MHQLLINRSEKIEIKKLKSPKAFIGYSQTVSNIRENLEEHNPIKKRKVLIVFDDMNADMETNRQFSPIVTELFLRQRKLNISPVFLSQSYCITILSKCLKRKD